MTNVKLSGHPLRANQKRKRLLKRGIHSLSHLTMIGRRKQQQKRSKSKKKVMSISRRGLRNVANRMTGQGMKTVTKFLNLTGITAMGQGHPCNHITSILATITGNKDSMVTRGK